MFAENLLNPFDEKRCVLVAESFHKSLKQANDHIIKMEHDFPNSPSKFYEPNVWRYSALIKFIPTGRECQSNPEQFLRRGDHICINRLFYRHDAIYIGNEKVDRNFVVSTNNTPI